MEELNSAYLHSQAKCQLIQTSYIKQIKLFLFLQYIKILLTELSRSLWENLDLGRVWRTHYAWSVLRTLVKILPYRPSARLIRAKYSPEEWIVLMNPCQTNPYYLQSGKSYQFIVHSLHSDYLVSVCVHVQVGERFE